MFLVHNMTTETQGEGTDQQEQLIQLALEAD